MRSFKRILLISLAVLAPSSMALALEQGEIETYAGGGPNNVPALSAGLAYPVYTAFDADGSFYITNYEQHRVFKVDPSGILTVVAGNGSVGFSGDGGPATDARLGRPYGLAFDAEGNLYIAENGNCRIRKVDATTGIITTVAGNGIRGYSGDGGPATSASLFFPRGIAIDSAGNLFIASEGSHRIRKIDSSGIITTVAGNGTAGYSGDGGPATNASLSRPFDVAVDTMGNLYIADYQNHRIRKVDTSGTITSLPYFFAGPLGVASDDAGNLFISEYWVHRVYKFSDNGGKILVAGNGTRGYSGDGGPATSAQLAVPLGLSVDAAGNLFIPDYGNLRIRKVDTDGIITTVAGNGSPFFSGDGGLATNAQIRPLGSASVDSIGNLIIADSINNRIRKVDVTTGIITTVAGTGSSGYSGDEGPATSARLYSPYGVTVDGADNLIIADSGNSRIRKVDATTGIITTVAGNGTAGYSGDGGPATIAQLYVPSSVAVDACGNLYIADTRNHRIRMVDSEGIITTVAGSDYGTYPGGDGGPATSARLFYPYGVAVDGVGNLFIADTNGHRIRMVDTDGIITTVAGTGSSGYSGDGGPATSARLYSPYGVTVDGAGNLFIADRMNHRVRMVDADGIITTVAGNGSNGYSGDGGPATDAQLGYPHGFAVDDTGSLFIVDSGNKRIRRVLIGEVEPPLVKDLTLTPNPVSVGTFITITAQIDDTSTGGSSISSAQYRVDDTMLIDMTPVDGQWDDASEWASATLGPFAQAGIHEVCVQGTDSFDNTSEPLCELLVVFDPEGGFVTGGGWFNSPEGAWTQDPTLTGKANFGFMAKYQKKTNLPIGETEFQFNTTGLSFYSSSYDWLVIAGAKAMFKGVGLVNEQPGYGFMLIALDEALTPSAETDRFRIKIWDINNGDAVIYDNETGEDEDADPSTEVVGGAIIIHTPKEK